MTNPAKLAAVVLAGGKAKPDFVAATGVTNRALVELAPGRTMLDFILAALRDSQYVGDIFVVGDIITPSGEPLITQFASDIALLEPGDSLIDNIIIGFEAVGAASHDHVLLVSADIPFVDGAAIDDYCEKAMPLGAELCYPIIPMAEYNKRFANMKRTTLKLREGEYTGGNVMLVRAGAIVDNQETIRAAYAARKSPLALGKILGRGLLLRILASQIAFPTLLTIPLLEHAVGKAFGPTAKARAVVTPYASLGTDVDKAEDVRIARRMLS